MPQNATLWILKVNCLHVLLFFPCKVKHSFSSMAQPEEDCKGHCSLHMWKQQEPPVLISCEKKKKKKSGGGGLKWKIFADFRQFSECSVYFAWIYFCMSFFLYCSYISSLKQLYIVIIRMGLLLIYPYKRHASSFVHLSAWIRFSFTGPKLWLWCSCKISNMWNTEKQQEKWVDCSHECSWNVQNSDVTLRSDLQTCPWVYYTTASQMEISESKVCSSNLISHNEDSVKKSGEMLSRSLETQRTGMLARSLKMLCGGASLLFSIGALMQIPSSFRAWKCRFSVTTGFI